jgi:hypothetical protein
MRGGFCDPRVSDAKHTVRIEITNLMAGSNTTRDACVVVSVADPSPREHTNQFCMPVECIVIVSCQHLLIGKRTRNK